ncbi:proline-rich proteoglycan 2-like, partial [Corapipo altera]|uniref:proline-rich proteoglycan 2-like n=1 Tax=Corapipo altera TaxID=415028 RepID=UPI000FD69FF5
WTSDPTPAPELECGFRSQENSEETMDVPQKSSHGTKHGTVRERMKLVAIEDTAMPVPDPGSSLDWDTALGLGHKHLEGAHPTAVVFQGGAGMPRGDSKKLPSKCKENMERVTESRGADPGTRTRLSRWILRPPGSPRHRSPRGSLRNPSSGGTRDGIDAPQPQQRPDTPRTRRETHQRNPIPGFNPAALREATAPGAEGGRNEGIAPRSPGQVLKHPEPPAAPGRRRGTAPGSGNSRWTRAHPEFWVTDTETRKCCVELGPARTPRPGNGVGRSIPTQPVRILEFLQPPERGMAPAEPPGPLRAHTGTAWTPLINRGLLT